MPPPTRSGSPGSGHAPEAPEVFVTARRLLFMTFFGIAMGFLEAAVVVYLRLLYYPDGFDFPLIQLPWSVAVVELAREGATLVMLASVAILAGRTNWERFAWFAYLFGVWDIIYYVGLKMMLNWPDSLFTWDILFLLPLIWVGPVLAPLLISAALVTAALVVLHHGAAHPDPSRGAGLAAARDR